MPASPSPEVHFPSTYRPFVAGIRAALTSVFLPVTTGTYIGIGALAHDLGFSLLWVLLSTVLVWAGPAQVIVISALGTGATLLEAAIAVTLSAVRLLPMMVTLMPVLRQRDTRAWRLILPAHFTAVNLWILGLQHAPHVPREHRITFHNGMGVTMMTVACAATAIGFYLAANLPALFTAALLFLTPLSFLMSIARNARILADRLALVLGLVVGPALAAQQVGLDLLWTGIGGGTLAYLVHRFREALP
jgi:predicted branched-subunit amino acid permease